MKARRQRGLLSCLALGTALNAGACAQTSSTAVMPSHMTPAPVTTAAPASAAPEEVAPPASHPDVMATPPIALPPHLRPGEPTRVKLPGYRSAQVIHGRAGVTRALVYLHGICGDVDKIRSWANAVAGYVTTIALYGNKACPTTPSRMSWNQDIEFIDALVQTALQRVATERDGQLDVHRVVLFGYSQGASRAQQLLARHPERYPWVILGGPPALPRLEHVQRARATALLVGSEEFHRPLSEAAEQWAAAGLRARLDVFPGAGHGSFGPSAGDVMVRTLRWLLESTEPETVEPVARP